MYSGLVRVFCFYFILMGRNGGVIGGERAAAARRQSGEKSTNFYGCLEFVWMFLIASKVGFNGSLTLGIVISLFSCNFF
jgi:hypothetical protein